ncbi:MAG: AgmX/PglI C-terminal domain-containing protein [Pseudomonadota bacterium]
MDEVRCQQIRDQLHAFRGGEGTPLWRQSVEVHVAGCASCRSELWLQAELESAAKQGPPPLSDARKRVILEGVLEDIEDQPSVVARVRRLGWPRLAVPAVAMAAAAAMMLWLHQPEPQPELSGWVQAGLGVEAFAPEAAALRYEATPDRPILVLERQTVMVRFTRPEGVQPLEVRTPHATVYVRGTVFFVEVREDQTVIGVQHGLVEVMDAEGRSVMVGSQQQAATTVDGFAREEPRSPHFAMLDALFPEEEPPPLDEPRPLPADPKPRPRPPRVRATPPDPDAIAAVVARNRYLIRECYESALKKDSSLAGTVEVEIVYGAEGQVLEARLLDQGIGVDEVHDCMLQRISSWRFPTSDAGAVTVRVPFVLTLAPNKIGK